MKGLPVFWRQTSVQFSSVVSHGTGARGRQLEGDTCAGLEPGGRLLLGLVMEECFSGDGKSGLALGVGVLSALSRFREPLTWRTRVFRTVEEPVFRKRRTAPEAAVLRRL